MRLIVTSFLMFFVFLGNAQEAVEAEFPQDFFGIYTGTLYIHSASASKEIPMEFHLQSTETEGLYMYKLVYGAGEARQVRDYLLRAKDHEKGIYEVDEQNGIILENRVIDHKMYTLFEVQGSLLTTFISFKKDHLLFEVVFSDRSKKQSSGGQATAIPEVLSYPISVVQKARLIKQ